MHSNAHRNYTRALLIWVLVLGTVLAIGNWLIDPFALFGSPTWRGFNRLKPEIVKNDRAAKAQMIDRLHPSALIVGNSRSLNGIPTNHPAWSSYSVFNGALTAGYLGEALEIMRFAHDGGRLRRVLLNIDELNYRAGGDPTSRYNPQRYQRDAVGALVRAADRAQALFTDHGLRASYRTWSARHGELMESDAAVVLPDGSVDQEVFFNAISQKGGARAAFARVERQALPPVSPVAIINQTNRTEMHVSAEATLMEILRFCRRERIDLSIFLPPIHLRALAEEQLSNSLGMLLEVRRSVLNTVRLESIEADSPPVPVFDFLHLNTYTAESIPPFGDATHRMKWFFEGSHFTQRFGGVVLDTIYAAGSPVDAEGHLIATPLSEASISSGWRELEVSLRRWMDSNAQEVDDLRKSAPK